MARRDLADQLERSLADLLELVAKSLDGFEVPAGTRFKVLGGIVAAEHEHVSAVLELLKGWRLRSAEILLRSLMEGWVVARYVMEKADDSRANQYIAKGLRSNRALYDRLLRLVQQYPADEAAILGSVGLSSSKECKERLAEVDKKIKGIEVVSGPFPSLEECTRSLDMGSGLTYALVYGPILSETAHIGPVAALAFLDERRGSRPENEPARMLWTTLAFYVDLARLAARHIANPSESELSPYDAVLSETRTKLSG